LNCLNTIIDSTYIKEEKMKYLKFLIMILILFVPWNSISADSKTKVLKPKNATTKIKTIISGKSKNYYPISKTNPSLVSVKGPGKLRVITRVQFISDAFDELDYVVCYKIDGVMMEDAVFENVKRSSNAIFRNEIYGVPGDGKDFILELGMGEHTVELSCGAEFPIFTARYLFTKTKEKIIDWVSKSPSYPNEPVDLVNEENVIHYFRFSNSKPLKVKITGPTIVRVLNRLENHYYMKGRINYRVQVKEDGDIKNTYLLSSVRSEVTSYKKDGEKIPGKAKEIVISVPGGTHVYEIIPLDEDKNSILGRILFPKNDIKLEE
jgi:hypothetical protein